MNLLIAIHGAHTQTEQMQAQRETWLKDLTGADYKFFRGNPASDEADVVSLDMPDGPIWERPGYRSMVGNRKTEAICKYALEQGYDFVFKCDDDTYVRVNELLASGFEQHDYSGTTETHYTRELGWYRWAQGGAGYWLSRRAMEIVANDGLTTIPAEDFNVGNVLAAHGIEPHHDPRYVASMVLPVGWITAHKVTPALMRQLHAAL